MVSRIKMKVTILFIPNTFIVFQNVGNLGSYSLSDCRVCKVRGEGNSNDQLCANEKRSNVHTKKNHAIYFSCQNFCEYVFYWYIRLYMLTFASKARRHFECFFDSTNTVSCKILRG